MRTLLRLVCRIFGHRWPHSECEFVVCGRCDVAGMQIVYHHGETGRTCRMPPGVNPGPRWLRVWSKWERRE